MASKTSKVADLVCNTLEALASDNAAVRAENDKVREVLVAERAALLAEMQLLIDDKEALAIERVALRAEKDKVREVLAAERAALLAEMQLLINDKKALAVKLAALRTDREAHKKEINDLRDTNLKLETIACVSPYKRCLLTTQPSIVVGLLESTAEDILKELRSCFETDVKERLPVVVVRAPPRHGKSLLLDLVGALAEKDRNFFVVAITYNNRTPVLAAEIASSGDACWGFVARIMLATFHVIDYEALSLSRAIGTLRERFSNPQSAFCFLMKSAQAHLRPILITVDEVTKLSDGMSPHDVLTFARFLAIVVAPASANGCRNGRGMVMTAFTESTKSLFTIDENGSSGLVELPMCLPSYDFNDTKKLLKLILFHYCQRNVDFPAFIWESCKSHPGILGYVLEIFARHGAFPFRTFQDFVAGPQLKYFVWLRREAIKLWPLLEKFLTMSMQGTTIPDSDEQALVHKQLALRSMHPTEGEHVTLVPVALSVVTLSLPKGTSPFADVLGAALTSCANKTVPSGRGSVGGSSKEGVHFEEFVYMAIRLRTMVAAIDAKIVCPRSDWLHGADTVGSFSGSRTTPAITVILATSAPCLSRLLTAPLYQLFPIGCEEVVREMHEESKNMVTLGQYAALLKQGGDAHEKSCGTRRAFTVNVPAYANNMGDATAAHVFPTSVQSLEVAKFPSEVKQMQRVIDAACHDPSTTFLFKPTNGTNALCDVAMVAVYGGTVQVMLIEMKDRKNAEQKDFQDKVRCLYNEKVVDWAAAIGYCEQKGKLLTVEYLLAGRCKVPVVLQPLVNPAAPKVAA